jgi:hypothetical protein
MNEAHNTSMCLGSLFPLLLDNKDQGIIFLGHNGAGLSVCLYSFSPLGRGLG